MVAREPAPFLFMTINHEEGDAVSGTKPGCDPAREQQQTPVTFDEAHELLRRQRPESGASDEERAAFYRHCAEVFTETAKIDRRRRKDAMLWAAICMWQAEFVMVWAQAFEEELEPDQAGEGS